MEELTAAKEAEEAKIGEWAPSAITHKSKDAEICCNEADTTCEPFPECCDCPSSTGRMKKVLGKEL